MRLTSTRRRFLKTSGISLVSTGIAGFAEQFSAQAVTASPIEVERHALTGREALQKLLQGNVRFQKGTPLWPDQNPTRREALATKQAPFALIFSCVDSRVPPELIFDQGLGDLFTIRTAGHVLDKAALGSLEFGVAELGIPLLVVMGHERCGAVGATISAIDKHEKAPGSIQTLVDYIRPAAMQAQGTGAVRFDNAVRINTVHTVNILSASAIIKSALASKKLEIVGARYDLDTGAVSIITH